MSSTVTMYSVCLFLVELLNIHKNPVSYKLISIRDRILRGHSFRNITKITMDQCFAKCLEDCECLSFQICDNMCQLCSSNRKQDDFLQQRKGCTHFDFEREDPPKRATSVQKTCLEDTNCCLTSQPCKNGGTCVFPEPTATHNRRFTCNCRPGYLGVYCKQPIRSCRGHVKNKNNNINGIYDVIDKSNEAFPVHCRFESGIAWTRIHRHENSSQCDAVKNDTPVNEDYPKKKPYRLSSSRMETIRQNSTRWRIIYGRNINNTWKDNIVTIDPHNRACVSCIQTVKSSHHIRKNENCNLTNFGSLNCNCKNRTVDGFGLYCCITSADSCSELFTRIWLGDKYPEN